MEKTVIEINGVKMEIDLRHAKRIDELRVGDRVKVLIKNYSDYSVYPGTVIGFEPFQNLPTIIIAYIKADWNSAELTFLYFNTATKETEVVKSIDEDHLDLSKAEIVKKFDGQIEKKLLELKEIERKRDYFLSHFGAYWKESTEAA